MCLHTDTVTNNFSRRIYFIFRVKILNHGNNFIRHLISIIIIVHQAHLIRQTKVLQNGMSNRKCFFDVNRCINSTVFFLTVFIVRIIHFIPITLFSTIVIVCVLICHVPVVNHFASDINAITVFIGINMRHNIAHQILQSSIHNFFRDICTILAEIFFEKPLWCLFMPDKYVKTHFHSILISNIYILINGIHINNRIFAVFILIGEFRRIDISFRVCI